MLRCVLSTFPEEKKRQPEKTSTSMLLLPHSASVINHHYIFVNGADFKWDLQLSRRQPVHPDRQTDRQADKQTGGQTVSYLLKPHNMLI